MIPAWVGKVRGSINKVSTKRNTINIYKFITGSLAVASVAVLGITATTYADDVTELTQVIDAGVPVQMSSTPAVIPLLTRLSHFQ